MADPKSTSIEPLDQESEKGGRNWTRYLLIGLGVFGAFIIIALILTIVFAATDNQAWIRVLAALRDFVIVTLLLVGIAIAVALVVLVFQLNVLIGLLRDEIKPLLMDARETLTTVRGTATFISRNVTRPVIQTVSFISSVQSLLSQVGGIRRQLRRPSTTVTTRAEVRRAADRAERDARR